LEKKEIYEFVRFILSKSL